MTKASTRLIPVFPDDAVTALVPGSNAEAILSWAGTASVAGPGAGAGSLTSPAAAGAEVEVALVGGGLTGSGFGAGGVGAGGGTRLVWGVPMMISGGGLGRGGG